MPASAEQQHPLRSFLHPKSVAVIGASSAARKAGGRRWLSIIGERFGGKIFPVTRNAVELNGYPTFKSVRELPSVPDLAVVMVPTAAVLEILHECIAAGIKSMVVISAGFGETGPVGKALEAEMASALRGAGARMLGPNSAGIFAAAGALNCLGWKVPRGRIAVITQSGNMAVTFTQYARAKSVGFASVMAFGNSTDLKLSELVEVLQSDEQTSSILIYCEGFSDGDGRRLVDVVRLAIRRVPIVMLKPGVSEAGRIAAKSHTGSLAGEDAIVAAALAEAGIIRASETEEAFDIAVALSSCARPSGRRIAVLSDGGGHATVVADCAGRYGLKLAPLSNATRQEIRKVMPARAAVDNPIDFAGFAESDPDSTARVVDICLGDPQVDGAIFAGHFGGYHLMTDHAETRERIARLQKVAAEAMVDTVRRSGKPLILHSDHGECELDPLAPLHSAAVPVYATLESTAKAMAALASWHEIERHARADRDSWLARGRPGGARSAGAPHVLSEAESRLRLADFGVVVPRYVLVATAAEAVRAFRKFGGAVAMKLMSKALVHKSDAGGVVLGASAETEVQAAFSRLIEISSKLGDRSPSILVTPIIEPGVECIIGAKRDPQFGPVVLFGAGGIFVELINDVAIRLAPTSRDEARSAIASSPAARLLNGYRGAQPADLESLAELLVEISRFISLNDDVLEVDLNPVIATKNGAWIADARLVIA
jgi:acetate---CoA ligase (ADP-forming)